jgi:hypothetical protein
MLTMAQENDIVLIYFEEQPLVFARIESILADAKPDWYHVKLLMLQVPLHQVSWILRDAYINGASFTMDGNKIRLEKVVAPESAAVAQKEPVSNPARSERTPEAKESKVISLSDRKKT